MRVIHNMLVGCHCGFVRKWRDDPLRMAGRCADVVGSGKYIAGMAAPRLGARGLRKGYGQPIPTDYDGLPDCDDLSASDGLPESDAEVRGEDFNSQFDSYKRSIEEWLQSDRPYLNADFSLQEVINRFNLNRTYASRIFNEGFGQSFILVMRHYRIEYAKELLRQNPGISITEVAQQCGYSTVQAFHKAFAYCNGGLTPGRYAQSLKG